MARPSPCCCCFSNNVRHLILILSIIAVSNIFNNIILFNFTSVLHTELHPDLKPVQGLDSLYEYSIWHDRRRRSINESVTVDEKNGKERTEKMFEDEGHPILPSTKIIILTTTTTELPTLPTTKRIVYFTNSPTSVKTTTETASEEVVMSTRRARATTFEPTTTTTMEPTTLNVVQEEVRRAIEKLEPKEDKDVMAGTQKTFDEQRKVPDEKIPKRTNDANYIQRSLLYSAPGIGVLVGSIPVMLALRSLGPRKLMSIVLLLSAVLLFPIGFMIPLGFPALFALRLLSGVCFSICFPFIGNMAANWGTLSEQLTFLSTPVLLMLVSPFLSWPFTMLLSSNEVPLWIIYGIHSAVTLITALIFLIFYRDRPQYHPWVNGLELNRIVAGKVQELRNNRAHTAPVSSLIRSISAWAIWIAASGIYLTIAVFTTYLPSFLSCQQVFLVDNLGLYAGIPFVGIPLFMIFGSLMNNFPCSTSTAHVRIFNTASLVLIAVAVAVAPILFNFESEVAYPLLAVSIAPVGFAVCGFIRSATIVGRVYAQHIIACFDFIFGISFTIVPFVVDYFIVENHLHEWIRVMISLSVVLLICSAVFGIFGRGRSATWAEASWDPLVSPKMRTLDPINPSLDECGLYEMKPIGPRP